jgi:hypothetical protein
VTPLGLKQPPTSVVPTSTLLFTPLGEYAVPAGNVTVSRLLAA